MICDFFRAAVSNISCFNGITGDACWTRHRQDLLVRLPDLPGAVDPRDPRDQGGNGSTRYGLIWDGWSWPRGGSQKNILGVGVIGSMCVRARTKSNIYPTCIQHVSGVHVFQDLSRRFSEDQHGSKMVHAGRSRPDSSHRSESPNPTRGKLPGDVADISSWHMPCHFYGILVRPNPKHSSDHVLRL